MPRRWISVTVIGCLAALILSGCRSEGARTSWFKRPASMLARHKVDETTRVANTEEMDVAHSTRPLRDRDAADAVSRDPALRNTSRPDRPARVPAPEEIAMSSTTDEPRTKTIAAFSPKPLHPLSPAQRIEPGPLPTGYQMRVDSLNQIGQQLASAATSRDVRFQFETIYNPRRAATYHTEAGHVLVTSSLLERVETRHQLAAALALEMAELIQESEIADESRSLTAAGIPQTASLNGKAPLASTPAENEIDQMAADLLNRAGFGSLNLAAVKRDLGGLTGSTAHATAKPASDAAEPRPIRLQPALAN